MNEANSRISKQLKAANRKIAALEAAGVKDWGGYKYVQQLIEKQDSFEKDVLEIVEGIATFYERKPKKLEKFTKYLKKEIKSLMDNYQSVDLGEL
tara:strand:- start:1695 stop:1979 length:285 start_codon:yes stop_codon:yes gene_type:complete